jgi:hypothetical protein
MGLKEHQKRCSEISGMGICVRVKNIYKTFKKKWLKSKGVYLNSAVVPNSKL